MSEEPDRQLENILYLTMGVAFMQAGFSSTRNENNSDYVLEIEYTSADTAITTCLTLFSPAERGHVLVTEKYRFTIDHNLDQQITATVIKFQKLAELESTNSAEAAIDGLLPVVQLVQTIENPDPGFIVHTLPAGEDLLEVPTHGKYPAARFDLSVSAATLILFDELAEYFHYGAGGFLTTGVNWPRESWSLTLGTRLSFSGMFKNSGVTGGALYFSTAGLYLHGGLRINNLFRAGVGISGGAALITIADAAETMTKTVPYTDFGINANIHFGKHVSLGAEISLLLIFDNELSIMGLAPALNFKWEV